MTRGAGHVEQDTSSSLRRATSSYRRTSRDRQISHEKNQSFLLRFDDGDATSLSGTLPAKMGEPQFHM
eukprot:6252455-Prymnesium_polylepis.1